MMITMHYAFCFTVPCVCILVLHMAMASIEIRLRFIYFYRGTDMKRVHRELAALMKNLHSQFDGQVKLRESTFEFECDDIPVIRFAICPNDGENSMKYTHRLIINCRLTGPIYVCRF